LLANGTYDETLQRERTMPHTPAQRRAVFVSDFDGTLARPDFYQLVHKQLVPRGTPDYWSEYRAGAMTHFDALKAFFAAAEGGESALLGMVDMMETPRDLSNQIDRLRDLGWEIVIVSAGCSWYVQELLARAGAQLPVFANPGRIQNGRLIMERPADPAYSCWETGIDKAAVVRVLQQETDTVAFAGDGFPDFDAACLVSAKYRFARSDLAAACRKENVPFRPFEEWTEVTAALSQEHVR
jgi:2-hydroxy-3-keto-5-methylthiopentenyl-1-phosphate phosphatase